MMLRPFGVAVLKGAGSGGGGGTGPAGPAGPAGADGADGADGASAYEVAVQNGFVGTEAQWLASLVGPAGADGATGPAGADGATGPQGLPGADGAKGEKGDPGPAGADSTVPGPAGADGASAYEVAVAAGFVGTEAQWLASLVGPPGQQGEPGSGGPTLQGDPAPYITQAKTYQITNYSSFSAYSVAVSAGGAALAGDIITFIAPATAGVVDLTVTVDGVPSVFAITVQALDYIPTPTPTPTSFGDPLEGGFYAGMIWGQLTQSSTSKTIATGEQNFVVPSMTGAPIVYLGQNVEVRSRANPANKMVGTVTVASDTSLTIDVTSVGGSGTFSDWSVMARFRIIVAPKASGEHAGIALKNSATALPTACQTLTEGFAATQAMRDANTSTVYPAAHWARNLNIGGRTDWYIPARDELELCWRNLKPATNNYVTADRTTAASFSYANNGSYGDTANTHGRNNNSYPVGATYTASVPGQTAATAFRTGGAEAYEFGPSYYWSSSDYNASSAWYQGWFSSHPGFQSSYGKNAADGRVRAVRRSVI